MASRHIVLAGDSIFDNDDYVPGEPGVLAQLRSSAPHGWSASRVAVDGNCTRHVAGQIEDLAPDATDLVISVGGNDFLADFPLLTEAGTSADLPELLRRPLDAFRTAYRAMLDTVLATGPRVHVCTIYTAIPWDTDLLLDLTPPAIGAFNDVIAHEAGARGVPVIRLDEVCTQPSDFAAISPVEPSARGGQKIVDAILHGLGAES